MGNKNGTPVLSDAIVKQLVQTSDITEDEVKSMFEAFINDHPNGQMSKKDFKLCMQRNPTLNALPKEAASKIVDHLFRIFDKDNSGTVDFVEFMVAHQIMADGSPEEIFRRIFNVFDVNQDGSITQQEMKRLVKDMMLLIKDVDNPEQATNDMIAASAFKEMDKDVDGKISPEEFVAACMKDDKLSEMLSLKIHGIFFDQDD